MKKILFVCALVFSLKAFAQQVAPAPITFRNYTAFPAYPLLALDSSKINSVSVARKKAPVVIMYFSPTCGHCQHQAEEITSHMKTFKDVQFLMVSSYSIPELRQFVKDYGIARFGNIAVASDPTFSMGQFFDLKSLPGIFVYNRQGQYQAHFDTNVAADLLAKAIKEGE